MSPFDFLPVEMLLKIFSYMGLKDLLSLSDTCRQFRQTVKADLRVKFNYNRIRSYKCPFIDPDLDLFLNSVNVNGVFLILKYLRIYGSQIKYLSIDFEQLTEDETYTLFSYMGRYCWHLEILVIDNLKYSPNRSLKRAFKSVKELLIYNSDLCAKLSDLNKWFPNVEKLYLLTNTYFKNFSALSTKFKHLSFFMITTVYKAFIDIQRFRDLNPTASISLGYHESDYPTYY